MSGLARRSRIGWHERNTIIHGLAEGGRILTQPMLNMVKGMDTDTNMDTDMDISAMSLYCTMTCWSTINCVSWLDGIAPIPSKHWQATDQRMF